MKVTACIEHPGPRFNHYGYGRILVKMQTKRGIRVVGYGAHRLAYMQVHGFIPAGLLICHHCDNPRCINPEHLYAGTHKQNTGDMMRRGRDGHPTKLTAEQVEQIRSLPGLTQEAIARRFGVAASTISRILNRKRWNR